MRVNESLDERKTALTGFGRGGFISPPQSEPAKYALANRLRSETILYIKAIVERSHQESPKSA